MALRGLVGFAFLLGIALALSTNRSAIRWRTVMWGIFLQLACAMAVLKGDLISWSLSWIPLSMTGFLVLLIVQWLLILLSRRTLTRSNIAGTLFRILAVELVVGLLKFNVISRFFVFMREVVNQLIAFSAEGARFVFGPLSSEQGERTLGFIFAFQVLPTIVFVASVFAILYYLGIMPAVVRKVSRVMSQIMGSSGAESVSVAASIFMGQTEAPLTIRPFLASMTQSELMTVMTAGMAHVSGGIMAAYVLVARVDVVHLLTAVVMTAPGAIMIAKIMVPETQTPQTGGDNVNVNIPASDVNLVDAAARGASEGMHLALNVGAMLIAFIALVAMVNGCLGFLHAWLEKASGQFPASLESARTALNYFPESLQQVLGVLFRPIAWLMGISWHDSFAVGNLLGTRMVLNEVVSFLQLGQIKDSIEPRSFMIATFALCGFANFGSIAIQVGGIGALAPTRRHDLAKLGVRAMIAGTLANFLSATLAGMIL